MPELRVTGAAAYVEGSEDAILWLTAVAAYVEERMPPEMLVTAVGAYVELAEALSSGERYTGTAAAIQWAYSGGVIWLDGDLRMFETAEAVDSAEATAGHDTHRWFIPTLRETGATLEMLDMIGAAGTTQWAALAPGTQGTLTWALEGMRSGRPSYRASAFVLNRVRRIPFDGPVEITVDFEVQVEPLMAAW